MQEQQGNLEFFSSGTFLGLSLVVVIAAGVLCWLAWHRSGYSKKVGVLELLRFVLICLVVVTLNQPEWLQTQLPDRRSTLAVLWDKSNSMKTRDVILTNNSDSTFSNARVDGQAQDLDRRDLKSRAETIQPLMSEEIWKPSDTNDLSVVFEPFSSQLDPAEEATDLNAGLSQVLDTHANLRGVVLLSDGDWNIGNSPVEAATRFRMRGIPVFAVGVGSKVPLPDLELVSMDAPTYAVANKQLRIPFVVRSTLGQDRDVSVTLSVNKKSTVTKLIRVPAMSQAQEKHGMDPRSNR